MVGTQVRRRGRPAPFQPTASLTARADACAFLGTGFADRTPPPRVTRHLLGVTTQQRPLWPVGGVGDLDAGSLQPTPDLVGERPVALLAGLFPIL